MSKTNIHIMPHKEDKRFATYKIVNEKEFYLFFVVHLSSPMFMEECARDVRAINVSRVLLKMEQDIFKDSEFRSIIVGDFNLQPYSQGISSVYGFNATMSTTKARKKTRKVESEQKYFYFNPTWKLMGDNQLVQGTYYSSCNQQEKSIFWYLLDEVLIRPYFIDKFNWEYFDIIEKTKKHIFISKDMPDSILKEQINLLGEKTNFAIYGKPVFMKVKTDEIEFKVATIFNVIVPALDNYQKSILIMYSDPENEYPVAITVGSSYEEDCENFIPRYNCKDKDSFVNSIKDILSSDQVMKIIQMLYSKASMLSN